MTEKRSTGLLVVSTLAWLWGVFGVFSAVALGIPTVAQHRALWPVGLLFASGAVLCYCGYGVRKRWKAAGVTTIAVASLFTALFLVSTVLSGRASVGELSWTVVNVVMIILVAVNWKQFTQ